MSTVKFELNDKNEIISYVKQGGIVGIDLVEFDESNLPDDFYENYKPKFYKLNSDKVIKNPDYVAPSDNIPSGPTDTQTFLKAVTGQLADHCEELDKVNARIDELEAVINKGQTKLGGN